MFFDQEFHAKWSPVISSTAPSLRGFPAMSNSGTVVAAPLSSLSGVNQALPFLQFRSATTAGSVAGTRTTSNSARFVSDRGMAIRYRFGFSGLPAAGRAFVGLRSTASAWTNVNPSTQTNLFGVGYDAGDTTLKLIYGGSSAQSPVDLGEVGNSKSQWNVYDLVVTFSDLGLNWEVWRDLRTRIAGGNLSLTTVNFPLATNFSIINSFVSNNGTSGAASLMLYGVDYHVTYF